MKTRDLLELFISGSVIYENVTKVEVNEYTDLKWLVGAVDAKVGEDVAYGQYLVYYMPIEESYSKPITPDYTLHDCDGGEIYLLRIDDDSAH